MQKNKKHTAVSIAHNSLRSKNHCAKFTLLELVIVIVLIALAGTLLPALEKTREQATQTTCLNNLKNMGVIAGQYFDSYDGRLVAYDKVNWPGRGQWGYRFIDSGLVKDLKTKWKQYVCPQADYSSVPAKNLDYCFTNWGYGMNSGWIVEDRTLYNDRDKESPYLEGYKSSNQSGAIVRSGVKDPASVILFADIALGSTPQRGYYLVDLRSKGRGFWDAHKTNRCSVAFLDGHVAAADKNKIAQSGFPLSAEAAPHTIKKIKNLYWYKSGGKFR